MTITLKYAGKCVECGTALPQGTAAHWHRGRRRGMPGYVVCFVCKPTKESIARAHMAEEQKAWNSTMRGSSIVFAVCPGCGKERAMTRDEVDHGANCHKCEQKKAKQNSHTCPTCGTENALSDYEVRKGYHCPACTAAAEFGAE